MADCSDDYLWSVLALTVVPCNANFASILVIGFIYPQIYNFPD